MYCMTTVWRSDVRWVRVKTSLLCVIHLSVFETQPRNIVLIFSALVWRYNTFTSEHLWEAGRRARAHYSSQINEWTIRQEMKFSFDLPAENELKYCSNVQFSDGTTRGFSMFLQTVAGMNDAHLSHEPGDLIGLWWWAVMPRQAEWLGLCPDG